MKRKGSAAACVVSVMMMMMMIMNIICCCVQRVFFCYFVYSILVFGRSTEYRHHRPLLLSKEKRKILCTHFFIDLSFCSHVCFLISSQIQTYIFQLLCPTIPITYIWNTLSFQAKTSSSSSLLCRFPPFIMKVYHH